mmetsp:Transcript_11005/g.15321  ORF Transcript_11005/g.15321 Transcript_11005/m.15321 type:complete len:87 (+) Transcript_11005:449-709(+)
MGCIMSISSISCRRSMAVWTIINLRLKLRLQYDCSSDRRLRSLPPWVSTDNCESGHIEENYCSHPLHNPISLAVLKVKQSFHRQSR